MKRRGNGIWCCLEQPWDTGPWRKLKERWTELPAGLLALKGVPPSSPAAPRSILALGLPVHAALSGAGLPSLAFPANIVRGIFSPLTMIWCTVAS